MLRVVSRRFQPFANHFGGTAGLRFEAQLPVKRDGFVLGEEIEVLALEFLDEQFYHAGRYTIVTQ